MSITLQWIIILAVLIALCSKGTTQQGTRRVSVSDPAADFTDLPQAVVAAVSGDMIYVYDPPSQTVPVLYTAAAIDKPLAIMGVIAGYGHARE